MNAQFDHEDILLGVVSMVAGLIARFSSQELHEDPAGYDDAAQSGENEND